MRPEKLVLKTLRSMGRPMTTAEIAAALEDSGLPEERIERICAALVRSGSAVELSPGRFLALRERGVLTGRMSMHRRGFGFVSTPLGEIHVSSRDTHGALHGDTVAVRLDGDGQHPPEIIPTLL